MGENPKTNPGGVGITLVVQMAMQLLSVIMQAATPKLKEELEVFLLGMYTRAEETPNPWDDFLIGLLMRMLGIKNPD